MLVGEVGLNRREYLFELKWWEIDAFIEGYYARSRQMWSAVRWQTFHTMAAQVGGKEMRKSGLNAPTDLIRFSWEEDGQTDEVNEEYYDEMQKLIKITNQQRKQKRKARQ